MSVDADKSAGFLTSQSVIRLAIAFVASGVGAMYILWDVASKYHTCGSPCVHCCQLGYSKSSCSRLIPGNGTMSPLLLVFEALTMFKAFALTAKYCWPETGVNVSCVFTASDAPWISA